MLVANVGIRLRGLDQERAHSSGEKELMGGVEQQI